MAEKRDLERFKKQRTSHRGQVTKLICNITNRLSEPDVEIDEQEGLLVQLQTKDKQLKSIYCKIESVLDIADIEMENEKNRREFSSDSQISLLVGADYYWDLIKGFQRLNSSLIAIDTVFGWSLQGRCDELTDFTLVNFVLSERDSVSVEMRCFWELGSLGIRNDEIDTAMEDKEGLKGFNESGSISGK
ncbi:integrase catalytic domain-containing protein [Nephila pilipes]|uniref:Integrase catalytic domain-containing protein n=1 Tax=Nephila pilipes TaxID=299642 RepID=A0A8X6NYH7_NEPPI|nr:integrase catalytic domain-containing protein [Nephila pilipes]